MSKIPTIILMTDIRRTSGREIMLGVVKYAQIHGPWQENVAHSDGIIIENIQSEPQAFSTGLPTVVCVGDEQALPENCNYLADDNEAIGRMTTATRSLKSAESKIFLCRRK